MVQALHSLPRGTMDKGTVHLGGTTANHASLTAGILLVALALSAFAPTASAQIAKTVDSDGHDMFVNAEPAATAKVHPSKPHTTIYLPAQNSFLGPSHPATSIDRDGAEKIVRESAERHSMDPALVRAVIETESNWNPVAFSRKGAGGFMQLIPTTAQKYGAFDVFNPQQNIDAGVRHLKWLLERYNGNLDLALAAYNAGEGAVDKAHGIPAFRETRSYVQKVQDAYFRPGSGRMEGAFTHTRAIHREADSDGRIIFRND